MVVKYKVNPIEKIYGIMRENNGILLSSDLSRYDIPREYVSILEKRGEIQRVSRGVYADNDTLMDGMVAIQARYKIAIYSHETALYLLGFSDRNPLYYAFTVPSGYNATSIKKSGAKIYFVKSELHLLGLSMVKSSHGNEIRTYNLERTICDIIRNRSRLDTQYVSEALKIYATDAGKNLNRLYHYAQLFRIQKIVREYMEILL